MGTRLELQTILEGILGSESVYFQPPASVQMVYPAIVYELDSGLTEFADDYPYTFTKRYSITVIDKNPDSEYPDQLAKLQRCLFDRHFVVNNLNHYVFNIYF